MGLVTEKRSSIELSLGPCLYNWDIARWRDFYSRIADESSFDTVYLGEVVCQKRWSFFEPVFADVVERLEAAGKQVILSTLTLIMSKQDRSLVEAIASDASRLIEANDLAAMEYLEGRAFAIGPMVNVYNEGTLAFLKKAGAVRVCLPIELPLSSIEILAGHHPDVDIEVQAFGRIPLAISARCYHARSRGLHKSGCQYVCGEDPNGMSIETMEGQPFLAVNGTQTQSHTVHNLIRDIPVLKKSGIASLRLYPHTIDMIAASDLFRMVLEDEVSTEEADARLEELAGDIGFSNGFLHGHRGLDYVMA